jgi:hypothetical protein
MDATTGWPSSLAALMPAAAGEPNREYACETFFGSVITKTGRNGTVERTANSRARHAKGCTYREVNAGGAAQVADLGLLPARVALDLVDGRKHARDGDQGLQLSAGEVAHADGAGLAGLEQLLHCRPRRRDVAGEGVLGTRRGSLLETDRSVDLHRVRKCWHLATTKSSGIWYTDRAALSPSFDQR